MLLALAAIPVLASAILGLGASSMAVGFPRVRGQGTGTHRLRHRVLVEDDIADAFAVPGLRERIVVTTGMLKALAPRERQALLAHENAHLAHHHQLYIRAAGLAAAANPSSARPRYKSACCASVGRTNTQPKRLATDG